MAEREEGEEGKEEGKEGGREGGFVDICIASTDTPHSPMATWGEGGREGGREGGKEEGKKEKGVKTIEGEGKAKEERR